MTGDSLNWIARAGIRLAATVNPVTGGPAAPLRASFLLDSFGPSLMPRKSLHQGIAGGLALLTADLVGHAVDALVRRELDRVRRIEAGEMGEIRVTPERMRGSIQ